MKIILIRHLESIKNVKTQFASNKNLEGLTKKGENQGIILSKKINNYIRYSSSKIKNIYCAESSRAIETANIIASEMNLSIKPYVNLNSIRHNLFSGLSENEVEKIDPEFIYQLKLYRLGLFNSYCIKNHEENENVIDFESRIVKSLTDIIENEEDENLKIIILHRSSILATLFYYVRFYYNYPKDFYGYVQIDVGKICFLEITNGLLFIKCINKSPSFLDK